MKKIINKTLLAMLAMLPFLAGCQSDPDVGTPLYPVEEEDMSPKVYVYSGAVEGNVTESTLVNTPSGLIIPEDTLRFYVRMTRPVSEDVTVSVALDNTVAAEYDADAEILSTDVMKLEQGEVTIPAGGTISSEEIVIAINDESAAVKALEKYAVVGIVLNASGAGVSKDYHTYIWKLYKETLNVYAELNTGAVIEGMTEIPKSDWTFSAPSAGFYESEIIDGVVSSYNYGDVTTPGGTMTFEFSSPRKVSAFACIPPQYSYYFRYGVGALKVETSDDGETWTGHGTVTLQQVTANGVWAVAKFYEPVTAKFFRYTVQTRANGSSGSSAFIGEAKIYE